MNMLTENGPVWAQRTPHEYARNNDPVVMAREGQTSQRFTPQVR